MSSSRSCIGVSSPPKLRLRRHGTGVAAFDAYRVYDAYRIRARRHFWAQELESATNLALMFSRDLCIAFDQLYIKAEVL